MALTPSQLQSIIDLVRRDPEARRQLQAALQMDSLLALPSRVDRLDEKLERVAEMLAELTAAHLRAEARLEGVEERLARAEARLEGVEERLARVETRLEGVEERLARAEARLEGVEERLTRLEQTVQKLADAQMAMHETVQRIERWQFGDEGRRKGEQYQRKVELQSLGLLGEGQGGGLARDRVFERVNELLARLPDLDSLDDENDPTLADIIWWKGDYYAVVEVSLRVDRLDVLRAARRAETLRQSGVDTLGVVIGEEWITDDTEFLARENGVAWKVGSSISPTLVTFRQKTTSDHGGQLP
ncbi:MAG: hypothetical protein KF893_08795 [Caldilineaceae bacterium]|nr:hypothetical protein [Caldilineaceae bacterium]